MVANNAQGFIEGSISWLSHYVFGGVAIAFPPQPSPHHIWDYPSSAWVDPRTLDDLKASKCSLIDQRRDAVFAAGFAPTIGALGTANEILQVRDAEDRTNWLTSQAAYAAAVSAGQGAVLGAEFRTLTNNTYTISYSEGFAVLMEMAAWGQAIMRNSWDLKDSVATAADQAAIDVIDIEVGWP
ncbi:hypothetical protein OOT33_13695 [Sphingobium sp. DEHP117]|uniref:DUF4376 domain-containing protein n=1 Tax=Sphingobium sp. DEHP117 TaxID=2993436 RepID=UPI0027D51137|nr:hypothetical protein [Sphingobium sp. DEHP117]MDQ4421476.1 hypothetical protein [Sphingobium sp. DEHP117]